MYLTIFDKNFKIVYENKLDSKTYSYLNSWGILNNRLFITKDNMLNENKDFDSFEMDLFEPALWSTINELFYSFIFAFDIYQTNRTHICSFLLTIEFLSFDNYRMNRCSGCFLARLLELFCGWSYSKQNAIGSYTRNGHTWFGR